MTSIEGRARIDDADTALLLAPRRGLVGEELVDGSFIATMGPVRDYRRTVEVTSHGDGTSEVVQHVRYELAAPLLGWLLRVPTRRELGRLGGDDRPPWWGPPDLLGASAWQSMGAVVLLAALMGYLSTLLGQTITYSASEFHVGTAAQGIALAVVRGDIVVAFGLVALADRRGRRTIALACAAAGCILTAAGAASPNLAWLAASQVVARGFVTASEIAATVLIAEAMPRGARAWGVGVFTMSTAVGAGVCVISLPLTGVGVWGWRILYAAAVLWLLVLIPAGRHLRESSRYESLAPDRVHAPAREHLRRVWGRRLALLAAANFCLQGFVTPAAQFQNEYLRQERSFPPGRISLFIILTVLPGAIGIVIGGRLADTRGRRRVAIGAVAGAAVGTVIAFSVGGWPMWASSALANLTGAAVTPALAVYGPELFGTSERGTAGGLVTGAGRIGSVLGLLFVGGISEWAGSFGPAFAILAVLPAALVLLVAFLLPETAHRSLEELNPEDLNLTTRPDQPNDF